MPKRSNVIFIDRKIVRSKALQKLTKASILILLEFFSRRQMKNIGRYGKEKWVIINQGQIEMPYRQLIKLFGISTKTITRSIDQLIECGFIGINEPGDGTGGGRRTTYFIEDRWVNYGSDNFIVKKRIKSTRKLGFMHNKTKPAVILVPKQADKNDCGSHKVIQFPRQK